MGAVKDILAGVEETTAEAAVIKKVAARAAGGEIGILSVLNGVASVSFAVFNNTCNSSPRSSPSISSRHWVVA